MWQGEGEGDNGSAQLNPFEPMPDLAQYCGRISGRRTESKKNGLVLSSFQPANIGTLINSSLTGYVLAFAVGLAAYGLGMWLLECWVFRRTQ